MQTFYLAVPLLAVLLLCSCTQAQNNAQTSVRQQPAARTSADYMREGSAFYLKEDFKRAIGPYQQALDLEKKERALDQTMWRVLVDNLGMAYGVTGDLAKAKETFEYGLSKDPTYPLFHYNMACAHAEGGDEDGAIKYLRSAFEHRGNVIAGEEMPDPAMDSSFARFMRSAKFVSALKEIKER